MHPEFSIIFGFVLLFGLSKAIDIICDFSFTTLRNSELFPESLKKNENVDAKIYLCDLTNLNIKLQNKTITNIHGYHIENYDNSHVRWLSASKSVLKYLPHGFDDFFPNIEYLKISGVELLQLNQMDMKQFPKLKFLWAFHNKLEELKLNIFDYNLKLLGFNFDHNLLKFIDYRIMRRILIRNNLQRLAVSFKDNICTFFSDNYYGLYNFFNDPCYGRNEILCQYENNDQLCTVKNEFEHFGIEKTKILGEIEGDGHDDMNIKKVQVVKSNFTRIPEIFGDKFQNLESLELHGKLFRLDMDDLKKFSRLKELNLANNEIEWLSSDTFLFTSSLRIIDLSSNQISRIGRRTFSDLANLTSLILNNNVLAIGNIRSAAELENSEGIWDVFDNDTIECRFSTSNFRYSGICYYCEVFEPKTSLEEFRGVSGIHSRGKSNKFVEALIVKSSGAKVLYPGIHNHFPNLKTIRVTKSNLTYIHDHLFHGLKNLQVVDMSHNKLMELPNGIFDQNENLVLIDFSHNKIIRIYEIAKNLYNLVHFKVNQNLPVFDMEFYKINKTVNEIFRKLSIFNGVTIHCSNETVPEGKSEYFQIDEFSCEDYELQQITEISRLQAVYSKINLNQIKKLNLSSLVMYFLPTNISNFMPYITHLEAGKSIRQIFRENFRKLLNLEIIILNKNQIEFIDDNDIFIDNPNLLSLSLVSNRIKIISEKVFINLQFFNHIDLTNNICTYKDLAKIEMDIRNFPIKIYTEICGARLPGNFKLTKESLSL